MPELSVVVACENRLIGLRISTLAPLTTPPVGSTTVPSTVPLATDCADAGGIAYIKRMRERTLRTSSREYVMRTPNCLNSKARLYSRTRLAETDSQRVVEF